MKARLTVPRKALGPEAGLAHLLEVYSDTSLGFSLFLSHRWWHARLAAGQPAPSAKLGRRRGVRPGIPAKFLAPRPATGDEAEGGSPVSAPFTYQGSELPVFEHARCWKSYVRKALSDALAGDVLEVGAGLGAATRALCGPQSTSWTCLEPDPSLAARLRHGIPTMGLACSCRVVEGDLAAIPPFPAFDCITYFDVLEHIEDDRGELRRAAQRLRPGGRLVVVAPAFPALYSPFDAAIGHHRRYTRCSLQATVPSPLRPVMVRYLDCVGALVSLANRWLLRDPSPSVGQIKFWDRLLVPCSQVLDPLLGYRWGRSIVGVWQLPAGP